MTEKQELFCRYYAECYNGTEAYQRAYQNPNRASCQSKASALLSRQEIKDYIREIQKEMVERAAISAEKIAYKLDEIANDVEQPTSARLKAYDLLQKQYGLQTTKLDAKVNDTITINIVGEEEEDV